MANWSMKDPEVASVDAFVSYMIDDEREEFTGEELQILSANTKTFSTKVREDLESLGFKLAPRAKEKEVRGFKANPHDRWHGKGSCPTHGGSGHEQIAGFAGRAG